MVINDCFKFYFYFYEIDLYYFTGCTNGCTTQSADETFFSTKPTAFYEAGRVVQQLNGEVPIINIYRPLLFFCVTDDIFRGD